MASIHPSSLVLDVVSIRVGVTEACLIKTYLNWKQTKKIENKLNVWWKLDRLFNTHWSFHNIIFLINKLFKVVFVTIFLTGS